MTDTGQELIKSAKESLAFAKGEPSDCVVYYPNDTVDTDADCPIIPVHDIGDLE